MFTLLTDYQHQPVTGWLMSEKLDGIRAMWTGKQLISRQGKPLNAPVWFTEQLPDFPLDGELYAGRGTFEAARATVQSKNGDWSNIKLHVFDAPVQGNHAERMEQAASAIAGCGVAMPVRQIKCRGHKSLIDYAYRICQAGGEGAVVRNPGTPYEIGRTGNVLKCKL
jgi:DNA ligase 1